MNNKTYWIIRKWIRSAVFKVKAWLFETVGFIEEFREYHSFRKTIIRSILAGITKGVILAICAHLMDVYLLSKMLTPFGIVNVPDLNQSMFIDVVVGSIGVAGVILGLYCASISSVYSTRYANAPEKIALAFQFDRLIHKCISSIISHIILGFAVIVEALLGLNVSWVSVMIIVFGTIYVLVSYSIAGNRVYQLSDTYRLADDSYRTLYRIINKELKRTFFSADISFQKYYLKKAEKQIGLLKEIHKYGINENHGDNSTMVEFMCKNMMLIGDYWKHKRIIGKSSLWFRNEEKYKKWHFSDSTETTIALSTGTALRSKGEHNYWWFEDEIMSINRSCFEALMEKHDYTSVYKYLLSVEDVCESAVVCKETNYYVKQVNWLKALTGKHLVVESDSDETKMAFAGVVERIALLYLDLILESTKYYQSFNIEEITRRVVKAFDTSHTLDDSPLLSSSNNRDFYQKVLVEIQVESHRITPAWVIEQYIAKDEYDYLNNLIDDIREVIEQAFTFGNMLLEKKFLLEACIMLTRFYEFESKLNRFISVAQIRERELRNLQIDKEELEWDAFRIKTLKDTQEKWRITIPELLLNSSSEFALINWENREEYPDFLGESYNHICEDAVDSIVHNNIVQFEKDFITLSKLMLLYQEYIRTDFLKEKEKYRIEYVYYMCASPIVEWAQIGGLAILWGEFGSDNTWYEKVDNGAKLIFMKSGEVSELAETMIQYVQDKDKYIFGIGSRGILETGWKQRVENAIREQCQCKIEPGTYESILKTNSLLLKAFCRDFINMGFMADPSEVFWVMCVNPLLPKEKQFHTRFSWEDKLNE